MVQKLILMAMIVGMLALASAVPKVEVGEDRVVVNIINQTIIGGGGNVTFNQSLTDSLYLNLSGTNAKQDMLFNNFSFSNIRQLFINEEATISSRVFLNVPGTGASFLATDTTGNSVTIGDSIFALFSFGQSGFQSGNASHIPVRIISDIAQTSNVTEWRNASDFIGASVDPRFIIKSSSNVTAVDTIIGNKLNISGNGFIRNLSINGGACTNILCLTGSGGVGSTTLSLGGVSTTGISVGAVTTAISVSTGAVTASSSIGTFQTLRAGAFQGSATSAVVLTSSSGSGGQGVQAVLDYILAGTTYTGRIGDASRKTAFNFTDGFTSVQGGDDRTGLLAKRILSPDQNVTLIQNATNLSLVVGGNSYFDGNVNITNITRMQGDIVLINNTNKNTCQLASGKCTISNTFVQAGTVILCMSQTQVGTLGSLSVESRVAGVQYNITSSNVLDGSSVGCVLFQ